MNDAPQSVSSGSESAVDAALRLFDREIDRLNDQIELCRRQGQNRYVENLTSHRDAWATRRRGITALAQQPTQGGDKGEAVAWQKRNAGNDWSPIHDCSDENLYALDKAGWETRPVYAAPQPASIAYAEPNLGKVGVENLADWFYNEGHEFVVSDEEEVARALLDQFDITQRRSLAVPSTTFCTPEGPGYCIAHGGPLQRCPTCPMTSTHRSGET